MRIPSASEVADYLLVNQHKSDAQELITNMKLQKLCYFAQGFALAKLERPLFFDDIEHWQHGPVVPSLWRLYNKHGHNPIPTPDKTERQPSIDDEVTTLLDEVILSFGSFTAWELRNMTHVEPPWTDTPDGCPITHQKMRSYFQSMANEMADKSTSIEDDKAAISLSYKMAKDVKFRELTERGLAELAAGQYLPWEEVRQSFADL